MRKLKAETREAIERDIELGKLRLQIIAVTHGVSINAVYAIRRNVQALRELHGLTLLPDLPTGRPARVLTGEDLAIRSEYLATGKVRELARKHGRTVYQVKDLLDRPPSVIAERQRVLTEALKTQN